MPKRIILIRHGETDFNKEKIIQGHLDTFLNSEGLRQAFETADKLKNEKVDVIFSSDLKRAQQTALIISQKLHQEIIKTSLLRERFFGDVQGWSYTEINSHINLLKNREVWYEEMYTDSVSNLYGIESNKEMRQRYTKFIKLLRKYQDKIVLVVTHGGGIKMLLKLFNIKYNLKDQSSFTNSSITMLEKGKKGYRAVRVNT